MNLTLVIIFTPTNVNTHLSCPAVSHSCSKTGSPSTISVFIWKSTPEHTKENQCHTTKLVKKKGKRHIFHDKMKYLQPCSVWKYQIRLTEIVLLHATMCRNYY